MLHNPKPLHPGVVLSEIYMNEMSLSQSDLARKMGCAHRKINEIVNGKRRITPEFALDLEHAIGTTPEMWVQMQAEYDLFMARQKVKEAA